MSQSKLPAMAGSWSKTSRCQLNPGKDCSFLGRVDAARARCCVRWQVCGRPEPEGSSVLSRKKCFSCLNDRTWSKAVCDGNYCIPRSMTRYLTKSCKKY